jgi:undecaprenyl-diphosphatase
MCWSIDSSPTIAARRGNTISPGLTFAAETYRVIAVGLVFFIGIRVHLGRWREPLLLLAAVVGEVTMFRGTPLIIDRLRPLVPHLEHAPPTSSFPSGLRRPPSRCGSASSDRPEFERSSSARLYRGMHYPRGILAGALPAMFWLTITTTVVLRGSRQ